MKVINKIIKRYDNDRSNIHDWNSTLRKTSISQSEVDGATGARIKFNRCEPPHPNLLAHFS